MRRIGLLGGMSWESSAEYYRLLNEGVRARRGGHHGAEIVLASLSFADVVARQKAGDWDGAGALLARTAQELTGAGAQVLALCTNTMHKVAPAIEAATDVPFLHIVDAVGAAAVADGRRTLGLLGTRFAMSDGFWADRMRERFGIEVIIPEGADFDLVDRVIFDELTQGQVHDPSRKAYLQVIDRLADRGADAVVLGCTEIGLLVTQPDTAVPLLDSTRVHVEHILATALS